MPKKKGSAYDKLRKLTHEAGVLRSMAELLEWDQEVCMPPGGNHHRAEQMALMAGLVHEKLTTPRIGELLEECARENYQPGSREAVNIREIGRKYHKLTCLPARLVTDIARATARSHPVWVRARRKKDFSLFQPHLARIVELRREQAEAAGYESSPYDALIDDYEPGETSAHLAEIFGALAPKLTDLLARLQNAPRKPDSSIIHRHFPREQQRELGLEAARAIGFDFDGGRLDPVVHPFCLTVGPGDVRITTRYNESFFNEAFFGIMHETGHGLYEQGLPAGEFGLPAGEAVSLGIHESQSRMWENCVGRGRPFWEFFFPRLTASFPEAMDGVSMEEWLFAINEVKPSFIRVEADEVTYNLHIILRFELERALIEGELTVDALPSAWNERFKKMFGIEVPDESLGVLQDVHWSAGLFGYFPTYCLGNIYAAQLFAAAKEQIPGMEKGFADGQFAPLLDWLRTNVHGRGMSLTPRELVHEVTGRPLDPSFLMHYLEDRFATLYGV